MNAPLLKQTHSIRNLAQEFGITTRTIRFYEEAGMLNPDRDGTTRIYSDQDRVKLKLILRGKRLGLSLSESRELIEMYDPSSNNLKQLKALYEKIELRREALKRQLDDIRIMENELNDAEDRCQAAIRELKG